MHVANYISWLCFYTWLQLIAYFALGCDAKEFCLTIDYAQITIHGKSFEGETFMVGHKIHNLLENFRS